MVIMVIHHYGGSLRHFSHRITHIYIYIYIYIYAEATYFSILIAARRRNGTRSRSAVDKISSKRKLVASEEVPLLTIYKICG